MTHPTRVYIPGSKDHINIVADDGAVVEMKVKKNLSTGLYELNIEVVELPP